MNIHDISVALETALLELILNKADCLAKCREQETFHGVVVLVTTGV